MLPAWIYALTAIGASGGYAVKEIYKTPAARAALIRSIGHDQALSFLYGQLHGTSLGAIVAWRYLSYAALAAGLMSIFLVVRHTRADEETGRLELIGSTSVGRHASLAVALTIASVANAVVLRARGRGARRERPAADRRAGVRARRGRLRPGLRRGGRGRGAGQRDGQGRARAVDSRARRSSSSCALSVTPAAVTAWAG